MASYLILIAGTPLAVGLSAIFRARREDIPAVVRALRGKGHLEEPDSR